MISLRQTAAGLALVYDQGRTVETVVLCAVLAIQLADRPDAADLAEALWPIIVTWPPLAESREVITRALH